MSNYDALFEKNPCNIREVHNHKWLTRRLFFGPRHQLLMDTKTTDFTNSLHSLIVDNECSRMIEHHTMQSDSFSLWNEMILLAWNQSSTRFLCEWRYDAVAYGIDDIDQLIKIDYFQPPSYVVWMDQAKSLYFKFWLVSFSNSSFEIALKFHWYPMLPAYYN